MRKTRIAPAKSFELECNEIASDKSISHRCAMFSLLCKEASNVHNYLLGEDTLNTLKIAQQLGLQVEQISKNQMKFIPPKNGLQEPSDILDCGNAGTAIRLYAGLLSPQKGYFVLTGDKYLRSRPMKRVIKPLQDIGANIFGRENDSLAPLGIIGKAIKPFSYQSPIPSAQIKSAMILAALKSDGISHYTEPSLSRDHTENMLRGMGVSIKSQNNTIEITPPQTPLQPINITIPADPSSAFFFAVACAIVPGSKILLKNVLLNPSRIEAFEVLKKMGADVKYTLTSSDFESIGDIYVAQKPLCGIEVSQNIAWLIDELPVLGIAMAMAKGKSVVKNAKELRVKESDRIHALISNLKKMGIECEEYEDGYSIIGGELKSSCVDSFGDHRIAMSFGVAGLVCGVEILDSGCIDVSFPNFLDIFEKITKIENS